MRRVVAIEKNTEVITFGSLIHQKVTLFSRPYSPGTPLNNLLGVAWMLSCSAQICETSPQPCPWTFNLEHGNGLRHYEVPFTLLTSGRDIVSVSAMQVQLCLESHLPYFSYERYFSIPHWLEMKCIMSMLSFSSA